MVITKSYLKPITFMFAATLFYIYPNFSYADWGWCASGLTKACHDGKCPIGASDHILAHNQLGGCNVSKSSNTLKVVAALLTQQSYTCEGGVWQVESQSGRIIPVECVSNKKITAETIGLGDISVTDGFGKPQAIDHQTFTPPSDTEIYIIHFSKSGSTCRIDNKNITCSKGVGFSNQNDKVVFFCQQTNKHDAQCAWVTTGKSAQSPVNPYGIS